MGAELKVCVERQEHAAGDRLSGVRAVVQWWHRDTEVGKASPLGGGGAAAQAAISSGTHTEAVALAERLQAFLGGEEEGPVSSTARLMEAFDDLAAEHGPELLAWLQQLGQKYREAPPLRPPCKRMRKGGAAPPPPSRQKWVR